MNKFDYKVKSMSLQEISQIANELREHFKCKPNKKVSICKILEYFPFQIVTFDQLEKNIHAYLEPTSKQIIIREDIYERACEYNSGRDRMTIAHEIGHYVLHKDQINTLYRVDNSKLKAYETAEWQAKALAGEFLCPSTSRLMKMKLKTICKKYCISEDAARIQKERSIKSFSRVVN